MHRPLLLTLVIAYASVAEAQVSYPRDVRPILADNCWACHGPDEQTRKADLRLDQPDAARHLFSNAHGTSELIERITAQDADERMPPTSSNKSLSSEQIQILRAWTEQGADYEPHWAFVPPKKSRLSNVKNADWPSNEVDFFVLSTLEQRKLNPSAMADKSTLIRRVTFDLTGLSPTPREVADFLQDKSPTAYEAVVDRLLNSPRYGEHIAASWLDLARYADTDGYQNDRYRYQHVWRDWVIMAFNENMPYDQFLIEQLAGDMLPNATLKQQIATGFCRNHRINSEDGSIPAEWHVENVVDRVDTLGTAILGLTIGCARCHDHKYDPISQAEYYRLFAYFNNVPEWGVGPNNGNSPPFVEVPKHWPNLRDDEAAVEPEAVELRAAREKEAGNGLQRPQAGSPDTVMVMWEMKEPRPTYRLERGQYNLPDKSKVLLPGVPNSLNSATSQPSNRLGLAMWLAGRDNPLTARVAVNHCWQRLFGAGLVRTSDNFGLQGELPSHPRLLDWLSVTFVESGWDLQALLKLIVMSSTYRQSSGITPELVKQDPENRLLARGPRFRLHPFMLRDQALAASGLLVEKIGGPSAKPYMPPKIWRAISNNTYEQDKGSNLYRRSLYTYWRRTIPPPTMLAFNAAEREVCVARKDRTNTPLQALTLMNNVTFVEASRFVAERMLQENRNVDQGIQWGFQLVTARLPTPQEQLLLRDAYEQFLSKYEADAPGALDLLEVGEKARSMEFDPAKHAAMTTLASLMLNLDESVTKE